MAPQRFTGGSLPDDASTGANGEAVAAGGEGMPTSDPLATDPSGDPTAWDGPGALGGGFDWMTDGADDLGDDDGDGDDDFLGSLFGW